MQKYTEFQSANHDLKMAIACDETDDETCDNILARRNEAAEKIYDDRFVDIRVKLQVAQIDCADRDLDGALNVMGRIAA